jgi:hypothetical protein
MNKNTKILLGVGVVAAIGYFVMKNNKPAKKASAEGKRNIYCPNGYKETFINGKYICTNSERRVIRSANEPF